MGVSSEVGINGDRSVNRDFGEFNLFLHCSHR